MQHAPAPLWPVSVRGVLRSGRDVLLARSDRGDWELPGGWLQRGDDAMACLCREIAAATTIDFIVRVRPVLAEPFEVAPADFALIIVYECCPREGLAFRSSVQNERYAWFDSGALPLCGLPTVYRCAIALA
jgi:8-oxo-dGTP pyrophosphatase MutT (NUDIX family)